MYSIVQLLYLLFWGNKKAQFNRIATHHTLIFNKFLSILRDRSRSVLKQLIVPIPITHASTAVQDAKAPPRTPQLTEKPGDESHHPVQKVFSLQSTRTARNSRSPQNASRSRPTATVATRRAPGVAAVVVAVEAARTLARIPQEHRGLTPPGPATPGAGGGRAGAHERRPSAPGRPESPPERRSHLTPAPGHARMCG